MDWVDLIADLKQRQQVLALVAGLGRNSLEISTNPDNQAPLTTAQKQRWAAAYLHSHHTLNHMPLILDVDGDVDTKQLSNALRQLMSQIDALQIKFRYFGSAIQQFIDSSFDDEWISIIEEDDIAAQTDDFISRRFDLLSQRPHRVLIIEQRQKPIRCIWCFHRMVMDGWSLGLLIDRLISALRSNDLFEHAPQIRFIDYAASAYAGAHTTSEALDFWRRYLTDVPTQVLTHDLNAYPAGERTLRWVMNESDVGSLQILSKQHDVPTQVILFSLYQLIVYSFIGSNKFAIRMPMAGRNAAKLDGVIGPFSNPVLVKCEMSAEMSLAELVSISQKHLSQAMSHAEIPLGLICKQVNASAIEAFNEFGFAYYRDIAEQFDFEPIEVNNGSILVRPLFYPSCRHQTHFALFESGQEIFAQLTLTDTLCARNVDELLIRKLLQHFIECLHFTHGESLALCIQKPRAWLTGES